MSFNYLQLLYCGCVKRPRAFVQLAPNRLVRRRAECVAYWRKNPRDSKKKRLATTENIVSLCVWSKSERPRPCPIGFSRLPGRRKAGEERTSCSSLVLSPGLIAPVIPAVLLQFDSLLEKKEAWWSPINQRSRILFPFFFLQDRVARAASAEWTVENKARETDTDSLCVCLMPSLYVLISFFARTERRCFFFI